MLIAYRTVHSLPPGMENDGQPKLSASDSGNDMMVGLQTSDFDVRFKDGKAELFIARHLTYDEARAMGQAMIKAADDRVAYIAQWEADCVILNEKKDDTCPTCDGEGTIG